MNLYNHLPYKINQNQMFFFDRRFTTHLPEGSSLGRQSLQAFWMMSRRKFGRQVFRWGGAKTNALAT